VGLLGCGERMARYLDREPRFLGGFEGLLDLEAEAVEQAAALSGKLCRLCIGGVAGGLGLADVCRRPGQGDAGLPSEVELLLRGEVAGMGVRVHRAGLPIETR